MWVETYSFYKSNFCDKRALAVRERVPKRNAACRLRRTDGVQTGKMCAASFERLMRGQGESGGVSAGLREASKRLQLCGGMDAQGGHHTILRRIARGRLPARICGTIEKAGAKTKRGRSIRRGTVCHIGYANKGEAQTSEFPTKDTAKPPTADRGSPKHPLGGLAEYDPCPASPALRGARHLPLAGAAATKKKPRRCGASTFW